MLEDSDRGRVMCANRKFVSLVTQCGRSKNASDCIAFAADICDFFDDR